MFKNTANIFNQEDYSDIKTRINNINTQSQRKWGKMSLHQMLEHCAIQLKLGLGIIPESKSEGLFIYRKSFGRWLILYGMPWPKGSATPSKMNMMQNEASVGEIDQSKQALLELLEKIQSSDQLNPHPFFGRLDKKDWGRLIWKHLDHHLRQFGN